VAEPIIDRLEFIEVDVQHTEKRSPAAVERELQGFEELGPVGQPRQGIVGSRPR
jgi:hypothetical protein